MNDEDNNYQFIEDEKYQITHDGDRITYCDFDRQCENLFLLTDSQMLQKRSIKS